MSESKGGEEKFSDGEGKVGNDCSWNHIDFDEVEIGDRISGGGVGVIYSGIFRNETVALKTLFDNRVSEDLKQEYMDELLVMSKLKHSNIVKFLGACMKPPNLFFVMEMCSCSLFDLLHHQKQNISIKECVRMAVC
jgi:serine/threonine protein kinase